MKLTFWDAYGAEETATILSRFKDNDGDWYYVIPPSTAAMYDRTPRIICPGNVIGVDLVDEADSVKATISGLLNDAREIAYENGFEDTEEVLYMAIRQVDRI